MKKTHKPLLAVVFMLLETIACGQYVTPTVAPMIANTQAIQTQTLEVPTATAVPAVGTQLQVASDTAIVLLPIVNVRDASGSVIGYVRAGDTVTIVSCGETACEISSPLAGYVWRGCLSGNSDLGCSSR